MNCVRLCSLETGHGEISAPKIPLVTHLTIWGATKKYRCLIQTHLKSIILFPELICRLSRNSYGTLIDLPKDIHLLLVLPATSANITRAGFSKLNIVLPQFPGVFIKTNILQGKVIGLMYSSTCFAGCIRCRVVMTANMIEIQGPELDIRYL